MSAITYPYLGYPGAMLQLPGPSGDITITPSRSETVHTLISGGQRVTNRLHTKYSFGLPYVSRPGTGLADLLLGFYSGLYDPPAGTDFVFVLPWQRNLLGLDVSTMGLRSGASVGWVTGGGTVVEASTGGPSGVQSGVLTWTPSTSGKVLNPGSVSNAADLARAPVHIPGEMVTVSLWMQAAAAVSVTFHLAGYTTAGAFSSALASSTVAATTSWQRVSLSFAMTSTTLGFVLPRLVSTATTAISIAGAQTEYASVVSSWQQGYGSPRVSIVASPGATLPGTYLYGQHTLTLAGV